MRTRHEIVMFTLKFEKRHLNGEVSKSLWIKMTTASSPCMHGIFQGNTIRKWKCVRDESLFLTILHKESPGKWKYDING